MSTKFKTCKICNALATLVQDEMSRHLAKEGITAERLMNQVFFRRADHTLFAAVGFAREEGEPVWMRFSFDDELAIAAAKRWLKDATYEETNQELFAFFQYGQSLPHALSEAIHTIQMGLAYQIDGMLREKVSL